MEFSKKKILFFIGFLGVVFLIGYGIYVFFFKQPVIVELEKAGEKRGLEEGGGAVRLPGGGVTSAVPGVPAGGEGTAVPSPPAPGGGAAGRQLQPTLVASGGPTLVNQVSLRKISSPKFSQGKTAFYDTEDGKFYKLDPATGDIKLLSDKAFKSVEKVTWSKASDRAVLEFPDGTNVVYDFDSKTQITLPKEWQNFSFDKSGSSIAFQYISPINEDNNWLGVSNFDGTVVKAVEPIGDQSANVNVDWKPTGEIVASFRQGRNAEDQEVVFLGLNGENFKSLEAPGRGFESKWSDDGERIVYSVYNGASDFRPSLWVASADGNNLGNQQKPLDLNTWPSKCAFGASGALYCAVPKYLEGLSGVYKELAQGVPDDIYRIDLRTGAKTKLAEPVNRFSSPVYAVKDIMVDEERGSLYFTDALTQELKEIKLR